MPTKILTGVYNAGYTLSASYSTLDITSSGKIGGIGVVAGAVATVANAGAILAAAGVSGTPAYPEAFPGHDGVQLLAGGAVINTSTIVAGQGGENYGPWYGAYGGDGVVLGATGSVTNHGLISGGAGGGNASYLTNAGHAGGGAGGVGVHLLAGGVIVNDSGTIIGGNGAAGAAGYFVGSNGGWGGYGVNAKGVATVVNHALIEGGVAAPGGSAGALDGVGGFGGDGGTGIDLQAGGDVVNTGTIVGGVGGAGGASPGTPGLAGAQGVGVRTFGGRISNGAVSNVGALIEGSYGVIAYGNNDTVTNFGTIEGTLKTALDFMGVNDVLIVEAGSTFIGAVMGGGGKLVLASGTGTLTGLLSPGGDVTVAGSMAPTTFTDFDTVDVGPGAKFTVNGAGTIAAGQTLIDAGALLVGAALSSAGVLSVNGILGGAGALALNGGKSTFGAGTSLTIAGVALTGAATSVTVGTNVVYAGKWTQSAGTVKIVSGDRLTFTGGANSISGTIAGAGTVAFVGGADTLVGTVLSVAHGAIHDAAVTLSGTIVNAGALSVTTANLIIAAGGATLTGGGALALTNIATNKIYGASAAATLVNVNNRISGGGSLGAAQMELVNDAAGVIVGNTAVALTIDTGVSSLITNAGLIEAAGAGSVIVKSEVENTGTLFAAGGTLTLDAAVNGSGIGKINGGTLDFASTVNENVTFGGTTGVLELGQSQVYAGTITGFSKAGTTQLDLADIAFVSGVTKASYAGNAVAGVLTVTDGTHTAHIKLSGNYTGSTFVASSDGHGGTTVVDPASVSATARFASAMAAFGAGAGGPLAVARTLRGVDHLTLAAAGHTHLA